MKRTRKVLVAALVCTSSLLMLPCASHIQAGGLVTGEGWDREFSEDSAGRNQRFALAILSSTGNNLRGYFMLHNDSAGPVTLEGARTSDREFWPVVTWQVADSEQGPWQIVSNCNSPGEPASLLIEPTVTAKLMVDMNVFRPFISKKKYGKVVLNERYTASFKLKDLLPPGKTEEGR